MIRGSAAVKMRPKFESVSVVLGLPGFTWFGALNASARNSMDCFSGVLNTGTTPRSILAFNGLLQDHSQPMDKLRGIALFHSAAVNLLPGPAANSCQSFRAS